MKKLLSLILILCLAFSLCLPAAALSESRAATVTYREINVIINGETLVPQDVNGNPTEPFIIDGTTYLPVRAVAGALGLTPAWNGSTNTVTLTSGAPVNLGSGVPAATRTTKDVTLTYRDIVIYLDGQLITPTDVNGNPVEPFIIDGTTYLPLRAVADALGLSVSWDNASSSAILEEVYTGDSWYAMSEQKKVFTDSTGVATATLRYTYDASGNILTETYSDNGGVSHKYTRSYYSDGVLKTEVFEDSNGTKQTFNFAADGKILSGTYSEPGFSYEETYSYDYQGNLSRIDYENSDGVTYRETYTWDGNTSTSYYEDNNDSWSETQTVFNDDGSPLTVVSRNADGILYACEYSYNASGFMTGYLAEFSDGSTDYYSCTLDAEGRIIKEEGGYNDYSYCTTYTFDSFGNRVYETWTDSEGLNSTKSYTYDGEGRLLSYEADGTTYTLTYDANGNCIREYGVGDGYTEETTYSYILIGA